MPMILVCAMCGRSQTEIRVFELTFRGYLAGQPHNRANMRRIKGGNADLCERCYNQLVGSPSRSFSDIVKLIDAPKKRYVKTKFSGRLENSLEPAKKPK